MPATSPTELVSTGPASSWSMTFERAFWLLTYATALWGFLALVSTGELHLAAVAGFSGAFVVAVLPGRWGHRLPMWLWNIISLGVFAYALYWWFAVGERMYAVTYFLLYLEANKLLTARTPGDHLQIYALSFFHILAASVSTTSVLFAPVLAVYLLLVIAALMTLTIRRDAERAFEADAPAAADVRHPHALGQPREQALATLGRVRYLDWWLARWLGLATLLVVAAGVALFWVIPRAASRNFFPGLGGGADGPSRSGFAEQVTFGIVGEIQRDSTIVMRAVPDPDHVNRRPEFLRIRGTALEEFTGDSWRRAAWGAGNRGGMLMTESNVRLIDTAGIPEDQLFTASITLEPENSGYLFLLDQPVALNLESRRQIDVDAGTSSVRVRPPRPLPITYQVTGWLQPMALRIEGLPTINVPNSAESSTPQAPRWLRQPARRSSRVPAELFDVAQALLIGEAPSPDRASLQLPLEESVDIAALRGVARDWTQGMDSPLAKANEIERRFKTEFGYTLDVPFSRSENHIRRFLVVERRGHCEYFATSMALMLRTLGIPARIVNGYLTDEWTTTGGGRYIVRQEHAHSWVEARLEPDGPWITFDPTPSAGVGSNRIGSSYWRQLSAFLDLLKVSWYQSVIDYDHVNQRETLVGLIRQADGAFAAVQQALREWSNWFQGLSGGSDATSVMSQRQQVGALVIAAGLVLLGAAAVMMLWKRTAGARVDLTPRKPTSPDAVRAYLALLDVLHSRYPRAASQTPLAYARALAARDPDQLAALLPLTEEYYAVRFAEAPWSPQSLGRIEALRAALSKPATG